MLGHTRGGGAQASLGAPPSKVLLCMYYFRGVEDHGCPRAAARKGHGTVLLFRTRTHLVVRAITQSKAKGGEKSTEFATPDHVCPSRRHVNTIFPSI